MEANGTFDPRQVPRSFYDEKIAELTAEHRRLLTAAAEINEEIQWWQAGRDRFTAEDEGPDQERLVDVDDADLGIAPENLRAAITFVMRSSGPMKPAGVIAGLREHGWLPSAKSGPQMVRNRMLEMHSKGELSRHEPSGNYSLTAYGATPREDHD